MTAARLTLAELLDLLGPDLLAPLCAPRGLDHPVGAPELLDIGDLAPPAPDSLLLAIGLLPGQHELITAVHRAAGRAAALVIKRRGRAAEPVRAVAEQAGIALLAAADDLPWPRLQVLCTGVTEHGGARSPGFAPPLAAVPTGDLFALANATAALAGGAVAIMDTDHVVLAYSSLDGQPIDETRRRGILLRRVPEEALPHHLTTAVWNSREPVRIARPGEMVRFGLVIRAGQQVLGSIWVVLADEADPDRCVPALREAAKAAALHLVGLRRQADADQDRRDAALRAVLDTGAEATAGLGLPAHLLVVAPPPQAYPTRRRLAASQLLDLALLSGRCSGLDTAATLLGERLYLLLPAPARAERFAAGLLERATATLGTPCRAVLAAAADSAAALRAHRADADTALDHLPHNEIGRVVELESVRAQVVLHRLTELVATRAELRTGLAERIRAHDERAGTEYGRTLLGYLRAGGDIGAVAAALHVHQNTVRQRLRRVAELFGVALGCPESRLALWLELTAIADSPCPGTTSSPGR